MDLNDDGDVDILSGSYSRYSGGMAGLFQVLWGAEGGEFTEAKTLNGSDGEPLVIVKPEDGFLGENICTRASAVDLNGDGKLDLASGNLRGTFAFFVGKGVEDGQFHVSPKSSWLYDEDGELLMVRGHSDPFFVDWDGDGDFDLLSGSQSGEVVLFVNIGSRTNAEFAKKKVIVVKADGSSSRSGVDVKCGDAHLRGPHRSTRVWADDVNGDGKLDLLIGDSVTVSSPAKGLDEAAMREELARWMKVERRLNLKSLELRLAGKQADPAEIKAMEGEIREHAERRKRFIHEDQTGFVWVYYAK